jgi:hypothetical protein
LASQSVDGVGNFGEAKPNCRFLFIDFAHACVSLQILPWTLRQCGLLPTGSHGFLSVISGSFYVSDDPTLPSESKHKSEPGISSSSFPFICYP